jgi:hypothetical protein
MKNVKWILIVIVAALCAGYFLGKSSVKVKETTTVEYRNMPAVHVAIDAPPALSVRIPAVPQFIWRTDTVIGVSVIDTAAIIDDWLLQRAYGGRLVEDSTGTIDYSATVQYNQLQNISLDYQPIQRTITTTKVITERWAPFLFVGGNSAGYATVEGGIFINKYGFSAELGQNIFRNERYIGGKFGMKF